MNAGPYVVVYLPDKDARDDTEVVFTSTTFAIQSYPGGRSMTMYLPDNGDDVHLDADDARSLAAALLAAADASEVAS